MTLTESARPSEQVEDVTSTKSTHGISLLQKMAQWNSQRNPLEHIYGGGDISPAIVARGQDNHAMMILFSEDLEHEQDLRKMYGYEEKVEDDDQLTIWEVDETNNVD